MAQTNAYFEHFDKSYYLERIKKLLNRWKKSIDFKGDCVKKWNALLLQTQCFIKKGIDLIIHPRI